MARKLRKIRPQTRDRIFVPAGRKNARYGDCRRRLYVHGRGACGPPNRSSRKQPRIGYRSSARASVSSATGAPGRRGFVGVRDPAAERASIAELPGRLKADIWRMAKGTIGKTEIRIGHHIFCWTIPLYVGGERLGKREGDRKKIPKPTRRSTVLGLDCLERTDGRPGES